jgi:outer membrane protein assembly factor BamB
MTLRKRLPAGIACFFLLAAVAFAADWPAFRGPHGNGKSDAKNLPVEWSKDKNVKWVFNLPGMGNSSPVVARGKVFITCAEEKGKERNLYCIDRKTGKQLWMKTVSWDQKEKMHPQNHYCGATPAVSGDRVVVWYGSAGLYCYDLGGKLRWKSDLGPATHVWGFGSSPVIHDGKVFLNFGPGKRQFLVAFNLSDGRKLWQLDEPGGSDSEKGRYIGSWSTPVFAKIDDKDQLVCSMPTRVIACDPDSGTVLWEIDGIKGPSGDLFYTSPLISNGIGVVMGGYGGPMVAFKLGANGNVSKKNILWKSEKKQPQRIGSGIILEDYIYIANADAGTAMCLELKTGKQKWQARLGGGAHWGSLVLADGRFYVTGKSGTTHVFKPNPEKFERIATNRLPGNSNSTPAISDGEIYLRTSRGVYCVSKSAK